MKTVAGTLKLDLAQYREKAAFSQMASDLDKVTRDMLERGARLVEILKQGQYQPLPVEKQIVIIYAGTKGWTDSVPVGEVRRFETELVEYFKANHPGVLETVRTTGQLPDGDELDKGMTTFLEGFDTGKVD